MRYKKVNYFLDPGNKCHTLKMSQIPNKCVMHTYTNSFVSKQINKADKWGTQTLNFFKRIRDFPDFMFSFVNALTQKSHKSILIKSKSKKYCLQNEYFSYEAKTFVSSAK